MNSYLTGGQITALTMVYWTPAIFQDYKEIVAPKWLANAIVQLEDMGLVVTLRERIGGDPAYELTPKGKSLITAIQCIPEPVNVWVIPDAMLAARGEG